MKLTFRQGLARYQTDVNGTPTFLRKSGQYVDVNVSPDPTIIVFAHRSSTYVVEESRSVAQAWGPFTGSTTRYLYWDVSLLDASLTRGHTGLPPVYTASAPSAPAVDQHWFDTTERVMKVWSGSKWVEKVRVFAGTYSSQAILSPAPIGSQAGLTGSFDGGSIVLDAYNKPLRQSDGTFVTSATDLGVLDGATTRTRIEGEVLTGMADENIAKYSWVTVRPGRRLRLGRSTDIMTRVVGIVQEDLHVGEVGAAVTQGLVSNEQWSWPADAVNRPVFCGPTGQVTLTPPVTGVLQACGYVIDARTILVETRSPVVLDNIFEEPFSPPDPPAVTPLASFTATQRSGTAPLTVTFSSTSQNALSHEWDFGDDGTVDASTPNATHTFSEPGAYSVRLRAINAYGHNDRVEHGFITVTAAPVSSLMTNLGVQLGGPLQVGRGQAFPVSVTVSNDGAATATSVRRVVTVKSSHGAAPQLAGLPAGSSTTVVGDATVLTLPVVPAMVPGKSVSATFTVGAPTQNATVDVAAVALSPERDSTLSDNAAELSIKVRQ